MSFGQQSGPPASPKQISYLKSLLQAAGHDDFRTARHEFGLTQRQAGGKFTSREASALIDRRRFARFVAEQLDRTRSDMLRGMPADLLATELERRGWTVSPP